MDDVQKRDDAYWRKRLSPERYCVLRESSTEPAFSGALYDNHKKGVYECAACAAKLFSSDTKFDSGSGWPSFTDPTNREHVLLKEDVSYGMQRVEVACKACGSHLGHVFDDGPRDKGGKRYCINSLALEFKKDDERKE